MLSRAAATFTILQQLTTETFTAESYDFRYQLFVCVKKAEKLQCTPYGLMNDAPYTPDIEHTMTAAARLMTRLPKTRGGAKPSERRRVWYGMWRVAGLYSQ